MSGILSKRQLARNEIALQELVKLPGNNVCADCQARNPGKNSLSILSEHELIRGNRMGKLECK